jgi:phosphoribosylamine-glycine ligase
MALADGKTIIPLLPSQDHKQAYDGDRGPNTGGMGAYCPTDFTTDEVKEQIHDHILTRTINGLNEEGISYKGVLYAGLMLTPQGPKVLEFNCRFGDPETQAVLPLLKSDLYEVMMAVVNQKLASIGRLSWHGGRVLGVMGMDKDLRSALNRTYRTVHKIKFEGAQYRKDIGFKASKPIEA